MGWCPLNSSSRDVSRYSSVQLSCATVEWSWKAPNRRDGCCSLDWTLAGLYSRLRSDLWRFRRLLCVSTEAARQFIRRQRPKWLIMYVCFHRSWLELFVFPGFQEKDAATPYGANNISAYIPDLNIAAVCLPTAGPPHFLQRSWSTRSPQYLQKPI
jgi:hypothetical protein